MSEQQHCHQERQGEMVYGGHGPRPVPPAEIRRRIEYLAPLVVYLRERHYVAIAVARAACKLAVAAGEPVVRSNTAWIAKMAKGQATIPSWFVAACCVVLEKPVEQVMGAAWVTRFGVDGRGGVETAPTGSPRLQRPWGVPPHSGSSGSSSHESPAA